MPSRQSRWAVALITAIIATVGAWSAALGATGGYEVWLVDQSNTRPDGGGTLYIHAGSTVKGNGPARPEVIDLGGDAHALCLAQTGSAPDRPHMVEFDADDRYAIVAYVATGHVLFIEAETRTPVTCIDVGVQAHAAFPAPDGSYVVVANQNGKLLQRISSDFETGTFSLDGAATLDLANGLTPSGALRQDPVLRPDNAPVCPIVTQDSALTFVTLRGGGLFVVDSTATPMTIVAEYSRATVGANGCGGLESDGKLYLTSGGGTAATPYASDLYLCDLSAYSAPAPSVVPPEEPAPDVIWKTVQPAVADAHGAVLTRDDRYLWVGDRARNTATVVDTATDEIVGEVPLSGQASDDPAPDLFDISPSGDRIYAALRGPNPLTGNAPGVGNAVGATPGLAIIRVTQGGRSGVLQAVIPVSNVDANGIERADPHAVKVRRTGG
jgi:DNA-binding beta-propeller fold protein YncE